MPGKEHLMKYDCVIFDLDGTLLNSIPDLTVAVNYALEKNGWPTVSMQTVQESASSPSFYFFTDCMPKSCTLEDKSKAYPDYVAYYTDHASVYSAPYDGICEMLRKLKEAGIKTAIISNKGNAHVKMLSEKYFGDNIDFAVGEGEGLAPKPSPDMYLFVKEKLGVTSPVYVGDSEFDTRFAKSISTDCISVTWGYRDVDTLKAEDPEYMAYSTDELYDIIVKNTKATK